MSIRHALAAAAVVLTAPAQSTGIVVNVPGGADGAGAYIYSYPVAVGTLATFFNPVVIDLPAGDYTVTPAVAGQTPGAAFGAWNFQATVGGSWGIHFVVGTPVGGNSYRVVLDGISNADPTCKNHFCAWDTEGQAIDAWLATAPQHFTLASSGPVAFVSADYYLPDNLGGISFVLTSASLVPEPASALLLALGLAGWQVRRSLQQRRAG